MADAHDEAVRVADAIRPYITEMVNKIVELTKSTPITDPAKEYHVNATMMLVISNIVRGVLRSYPSMLDVIDEDQLISIAMVSVRRGIVQGRKSFGE